jgi:DNA-binding transcriptional LysR family regulator
VRGKTSSAERAILRDTARCVRRVDLDDVARAGLVLGDDFVADHLRQRERQEVAREIRERQVGDLLIYSTPALGRSVLPDVMATFMKRHTKAHIVFQVRSSTYINQKMIDQQIDLGFSTRANPAVEKCRAPRAFHGERCFGELTEVARVSRRPLGCPLPPFGRGALAGDQGGFPAPDPWSVFYLWFDRSAIEPPRASPCQTNKTNPRTCRSTAHQSGRQCACR